MGCQVEVKVRRVAHGRVHHGPLRGRRQGSKRDSGHQTQLCSVPIFLPACTEPPRASSALPSQGSEDNNRSHRRHVPVPALRRLARVGHEKARVVALLRNHEGNLHRPGVLGPRGGGDCRLDGRELALQGCAELALGDAVAEEDDPAERESSSNNAREMNETWCCCAKYNNQTPSLRCVGARARASWASGAARGARSAPAAASARARPAA